MATGVTASTYQEVLGIAPEPQPADGTPVDPTAFIPITNLEPKNVVQKLLDQSWRGSMVQTTNVQNGPQSSELSIEGNAYPDTIGFLFAGVLGDITTTGSAAPFTHTISLYNGGNGQPPSYTITDSLSALSTRQYASSRVQQFVLTYDASKLLTYKSKWLGWAAPTTSTAPTTSYTTVPPAPSWQCAFQIDGTADPTVETMEVTLERQDSDPIWTLQNDPNPYQVHVGPIEVTFKATIVAANENALDDYFSNTSRPLVMTLSSGSGATATQIKITASQYNYQSVTKSLGNSYVEYEIEALAVGNITDAGSSGGYSPCKVVLQNALPANSYTAAP